APGLRDKIDALGRAADENDILDRWRVDEAAHLLARLLKSFGRTRGQRMRGAVHVRVLVRVEMRDAVDHGARLLRRRRVVEPDQGAAIDHLIENGKIASEDLRDESAAARDRRRRYVARGAVSPLRARQRLGRRVGVLRAAPLIQKIVTVAGGGPTLRTPERCPVLVEQWHG